MRVNAVHVGVAVAALALLGRWVYKRQQREKLYAHWDKVALDKRAQRDASAAAAAAKIEAALPSEDKQRQIVALTVTELKQAIIEGRFTTKEVVATYAHRARVHGLALKCVAEETFAEALEAADQPRASPPRLLEGIPVSVKDQFNQRGCDSTVGLACKCFHPYEADGIYLELLRDAGAIPFVRSNVPQSLMVPESQCAMWGRAENPWNTDRTPGGSTGGEAGLIAAGCSPLGLGSDVGGSIRGPCHFCGIYGFKPTASRMTRSGMTSARLRMISGQQSIASAAGPMGRSVDDLVLMLRALWVPKFWAADPAATPLPFNVSEYESSRPLRIGYYTVDEWITPAAPLSRAVMMAVDALKAAGFEVVPFTPPRPSEGVRLYYGIMTADGRLKEYRDGLQGERFSSLYTNVERSSKLPGWLRWVLVKFLQRNGNGRLAKVVGACNAKTAAEYWEYCVSKSEYCAEFAAAWKAAGIDAVICPPMSLPALRHGDSEFLGPSCQVAFLYNLLHYPCGVVPVTTVGADETHYDAGSSPEDGLSALMRKVAGQPHADELVLRVMKAIETQIDFHRLAPMATTTA